jgi:hypothetical protein
MNSTDSPGPVVVGIDGSDAAIGAAHWAVKEAIHQDVPLRLVYVIQTTDGPTASADTYPAEEKYAERSLRAVRLAVETTGLPVKIDTAVLREDVDSALIAESSSATLICVGLWGSVGWATWWSDRPRRYSPKEHIALWRLFGAMDNRRRRRPGSSR